MMGESPVRVGFILLIVLMALLIGGIGPWAPAGYGYGFGSGGISALGVVMIVLILMLLLGRL